MAENEILDVRGRRWRATRAALAMPNSSPLAIARCAADDLDRGLRLALSRALRKGETLLTLLRAAEHHPAALRAVVERSQDQHLARVIRDAIRVTPSKDVADIARCAADILIDSVHGRTLVLADRNVGFMSSADRESLSAALRQELDARRGALAASIEASLRGQPVRQLRRAGMQRGRIPTEASALVRMPLSIRTGGENHAPDKH